MPVKIFFCYAHEDELLLKELKKQLRPLQRSGQIEAWHDRDISAGTEWEREISIRLNEAQIILLLVSPDFIDSDYCYGIEMKRALERHKRGEARVIPVILRHALWQETPLRVLQALPTDAKPVMDRFWFNPDEAFLAVAEGIRTVVEELKLLLPDLLPVTPTKGQKPEQVPIVTSSPIDIPLQGPAQSQPPQGPGQPSFLASMKRARQLFTGFQGTEYQTPAQQQPPQGQVKPSQPGGIQNQSQSPQRLTQQQPKPVPQMQAGRQNFYDKESDPPGYHEEMAVHPHHKLYPASPDDMLHKSVLAHGWRIIGASRRGYGHAYEGKYREDDFAIRIVRFPYKNQLSTLDMALVAIADGVSAKEHSHYEALAAVEGATFTPWLAEPAAEGKREPVQSPEEHLWPLARPLARDAYSEECRQVVHAILMEAMRAAMLSVTRRAQQEGLGTDDLHSTLMVFLAVPLDQRRLFVASVQIGDGVLFTLRSNNSPRPRDRWQWIQHAQIQASGNEVQPFMRTSPELWNQVFQCEVLEDVTFVMGMTDGTADDIEPPRPSAEEPDPDPFVYVDDFYQQIRRDVIEQADPAQALDEFLGYKKSQSYDDRTVVCLYINNQ